MEYLFLNHFESRLLLALVFGALIGLERQWQHKLAGIKTNALVALGSAIFVLISQKIVADNTSEARVISQIVTGIGFLAGGVIMKEGFSILGINTAATIWCSGAIGCLSGMGFGYEAIVGTIIVIASNIGLRPIGKSIDQHGLQFRKSDIFRLLVVHYQRGSGDKIRRETLNVIKKFSNLQIVSFENHQRKHADPYLTIEIKAIKKNDRELESIMNTLDGLPEILAIKWELNSTRY